MDNKKELKLNNVNEITQALNTELSKYGASSLTRSTSLFTGKESEVSGISGEIKGNKFNVIMFQSSEKDGIQSASSHFTMNINSQNLSDEHIEYWNADNRFTKIYRQSSDTYLVMDAFLGIKSTEIIGSVATVWDIAARGISRLKSSYDRKFETRF